jgi:hypothetical protein
MPLFSTKVTATPETCWAASRSASSRPRFIRADRSCSVMVVVVVVVMVPNFASIAN